MLETIVLAVFAVLLMAGSALGVPLPLTLLAGFALFCGYGLSRGHGVRELASFSIAGVRTVSGVLALLAIVGVMAAFWRAAGTIPAIVVLASKLVSPGALVVATFLLCCLMSMLMGTAFGTAATMGIICMTLAEAMGANTLLVGGAVLAGSYFGDRNSPMSSSAALVATLTHTDVFSNVRSMLRTGLVPFALTCAVYAVAGLAAPTAAAGASSFDALSSAFDLGPTCLAPAAVVVGLSLRKVSVKRTLLAALAVSVLVCVLEQHVALADLPRIALFGYHAEAPEVARLVDGGGLASMANIECVVGISATYAGLFDGTGLLRGLRSRIDELNRRTSPFVSVLATGLATSCIACNQTLAIMLTDQLCSGLAGETREGYALDLEDTVVTCAALMPWSIAATATLSFIGAPTASILAACFLYLLPLCSLTSSMLAAHARRAQATTGVRVVRGHGAAVRLASVSADAGVRHARTMARAA